MLLNVYNQSSNMIETFETWKKLRFLKYLLELVNMVPHMDCYNEYNFEFFC